MSAGRLICFEGPNFAGKSEAVITTQKYLTRIGKTWQTIKFPTRSGAGALAYGITERGVLTDSGKAEATCLHLADMLSWQGVIQRLLTFTDFVLLDRYWYSSFVYNDIVGLSVEMFAKTYLRQPDQIIYLTYYPKALADRLHRAKNAFERNFTKQDLYELSLNYSHLFSYSPQYEIVRKVDTTDSFPTEDNVKDWLGL